MQWLNARGVFPGVACSHVLPEHDLAGRLEVQSTARIILGGHGALLAVFLLTGAWPLVLLISLASFIGNGPSILLASAQHCGRSTATQDFRDNSRTVLLPAWLSFFYWNMNYHVEHHMFPMVPYYRLPELHEVMKTDGPKPYAGFFDAYREIIPTVIRQLRDPTYFARRQLPDTARPFKAAPEPALRQRASHAHGHGIELGVAVFARHLLAAEIDDRDLGEIAVARDQVADPQRRFQFGEVGVEALEPADGLDVLEASQAGFQAGRIQPLEQATPIGKTEIVAAEGDREPTLAAALGGQRRAAHERRPTADDAVRAAAAALLADERTFIDLANSPIWIADEDLRREGSKDGLRMTAILKRNPAISRAQFRYHWRELHGPWALRRPDVFGFRHYVQNHTPENADDNPMARERNSPPAFDGVSEIYRDAPTAPAEEVAALRLQFHEDEKNFLDIDASPVFEGKVIVII